MDLVQGEFPLPGPLPAPNPFLSPSFSYIYCTKEIRFCYITFQWKTHLGLHQLRQLLCHLPSVMLFSQCYGHKSLCESGSSMEFNVLPSDTFSLDAQTR